jgi:hypothetical protein
MKNSDLPCLHLCIYVCMYICMYVYMYVSSPRKSLNGWWDLIHFRYWRCPHGSVPGESEHSASENTEPPNCFQKHQTTTLPTTAVTIFIRFLKIRDHFSRFSFRGGSFWQVTARTLGSQTRNANPVRQLDEALTRWGLPNPSSNTRS